MYLVHKNGIAVDALVHHYSSVLYQELLLCFCIVFLALLTCGYMCQGT